MADVDPIVGAQDVIDARDEIVVCDVRWYLDGRSGLAAYAQGHVRDAVFVDLEAVCAAPATPERGRHPLPDPEVFAAALGALGIGDDDPVVAYDDVGGIVAARLVWMLRVIGAPAALLDGGLAHWPEPLVSVVPEPTPVRRTTRPWPTDRLADASDVTPTSDDTATSGGHEHRPGTLVVDARATERYRGDVEPVDARAGHIPGAVSVPFSDLLADDGSFLDRRYLEDRLRRAGIAGDTDVIAYCGSGVTACHTLLALEHVEIGRGRLYPGSWSQWSAASTRPVATGPRP